jgi:hypothetical protein
MIRKSVCVIAFCAALPLVAQQVPFKGAIICPLSAPLVSAAAPGGTINVKTDICVWTGLHFGGQAVVQSSMFASGISYSTGSWTAHGFEIGTLANGDQYQGEWVENGAAKGSTINWHIVSGTGVVSGISGSGTIACPPPQGIASIKETVNGVATSVMTGTVTCQATGTYSLAPAAAPDTPKK